MNSRFTMQNDLYNLNITQADFLGIDLKDSEIQIKQTNQNFNIQAKIHSKAKLLNVDNILSRLKNFKNQKFVKFRNLSFDITNEISFDLEEYKNLKNLTIAGKGEIFYLHLKTDLTSDAKEKLHAINKNIQGNIIFKTNPISFLIAEDNISVKSKGQVNFADKYVNYLIAVKLNPKKNTTQFDLESKNEIYLRNLKFNSAYEIEDFSKIYLRTYNADSTNNNVKFSKNKDTISIQGEVVDLTFLLKDLLKKKKQKKNKKKNT